MSRSTEATRLRVQLPAETGVRVLVQWTTSGTGQRMQWHIIWDGGPTVDGMTALIDRLLPPSSALDRDELVYLRSIRPVSVALVVVRNLRLRQPPLGDFQRGWELDDHLRTVPYPERGSGEDDQALAAELCRITDFGDAQDIADAAARHGLAGLRARLAPPDNVLPFRRPER